MCGLFFLAFRPGGPELAVWGRIESGQQTKLVPTNSQVQISDRMHSLYICLHVCMCIYIYISTEIDVNMYSNIYIREWNIHAQIFPILRTCEYRCTHTGKPNLPIYVCIYVKILAYRNWYVCMHMYIYIYAYMCIYSYINTCIYIYIHTLYARMYDSIHKNRPPPEGPGSGRRPRRAPRPPPGPRPPGPPGGGGARARSRPRPSSSWRPSII